MLLRVLWLLLDFKRLARRVAVSWIFLPWLLFWLFVKKKKKRYAYTVQSKGKQLIENDSYENKQKQARSF